MRTIEINDNTIDNSILLTPTKQIFVFFPKEESQMFQSLSNNWVGSGNVSQETVNQVADVILAQTASENIMPNSKITPTDYIGAISRKVPTLLSENFCDFKFYDIQNNVTKNVFESTDLNKKITNVFNGMQSLRFPKAILNTYLYTDAEIVANGGRFLIENYGKYYLSIKPKYIETKISSIIQKQHNKNGDFTDDPLAIQYRRNIYKTAKSNFLNTVWNFEGGNSGGRLYGSVVEIWDSLGTTLKDTKILTECDLNFNVGTEVRMVFYPDNFGFNNNEISINDIIRIFPRETSFDEIFIEIDYKNKKYNLDQILAYTLNDASRDLKTGLYEIYDEKGFSMDSNGILNGNIINAYQITATDNYELRKRI